MTEAAGVVMADRVETLVKSRAKRTFHAVARIIRFHFGLSDASHDWHNPIVLTSCSGEFTGLFSLLEYRSHACGAALRQDFRAIGPFRALTTGLDGS